MLIVVGYVATKEGKAALRAASAEARLRNARLVVINSNRGGSDLDREDAARYEAELDAVRQSLTDHVGVEHEVRQLVRGVEPAEDLVKVAEETSAEAIRYRPAPPHPRGQAHPRVERPADPARRPVRGVSRSRPTRPQLLGFARVNRRAGRLVGGSSGHVSQWSA